ncbi:MAG: hypothetical protein Q8Q11_02230 [bacterium]|nr:hypothetical protein [bacterium]
MPRIEHHLDAIEAGIEGAIQDYERQDSLAFFKPEKTKSRQRPHKPRERKLDDELGLAEVGLVASGEIDLTEHPSGEIVLGEPTGELLAGIDNLDPHYLAAAIEIARVLANEFGGD